MFDIYEELRALVTAFNEERVDYALCGGLALAIHAEPRATKDIDLMVSPDDLDKIKLILRALGFKYEAAPIAFSSGIEIRRVSKIEQKEVFTLDLILVNDVLQKIWKSREEVGWVNSRLWVVSREGLIAMKRMAGRLQDTADIQKLQGGDESD